MHPIIKTTNVFYNKSNAVKPVSNPKVAIIVPSKSNNNVNKSKRILDLFQVDYSDIKPIENKNNLYNSIIFAKNDGYSAILCYDNDLDVIDDIAKHTVLPIVYIGSAKIHNSSNCNPIAIFNDYSAINATIFLIQILSIKYSYIQKKLEDMQNSI